MGSKGRHRTHCIKCNTERILLKNGRYICPKCAREDSLKHYHTNKKPLTLEQKENKKVSNLKWKHTLRDSGFVSGCCKGEICSVCGKDATNKLEEKIFHDDPNNMRHPLTAYVCREHFRMIVGRLW